MQFNIIKRRLWRYPFFVLGLRNILIIRILFNANYIDLYCFIKRGGWSFSEKKKVLKYLFNI